MKHMGSDVTNAYEFVKTKRPCISPNLHFMGQLLEFQKQLCCDESNTWVSAGSKNCIVSSSRHLPQQTNACSVPDSASNLINSHAHSAPSSLHLFRKSRSVTPDATNWQENIACPFPSAGHIGSLPLASVSLPSTPVTAEPMDSLNVPCSWPSSKVYTSALAVILYRFITVTIPTH